MCKILEVGMYNYEYLQLVAQGRDPVQEKICERNLIRAEFLLKLKHYGPKENKTKY